jgi:simple sugar transport system substrate-binding protein
MVLVLAVLAVTPTIAQDEFVFGVILVGPQDDRGWSQAHYEGGEYVVEKLAEAGVTAEMLVFESLNPADAPETTLLDVVQLMVDDGAQLIITTSDAFEEDTNAVAAEFPDIVFINSSGSGALTGDSPSNVGNVMGQMEWGKQMGGCTAALSTETGRIGYLGPLINHETIRLANSAYLGARYCWETYREGNPEDLQFTVTWIGFWFNIPGVTLDPNEEVHSFFDNGADIVISGIDTTEALTVAGQRLEAGDNVHTVAYDYPGACDEAPDACLGVPYFNWGPSYLGIAQAVIDGTWEQNWDWAPPDWSDINNADTSAVGFVKGPALSDEAAANLDAFIAEQADFAANNEGFFLWQGPLSYQDGTELAAEGEIVDIETVWFSDQLLDGIIGSTE